MIKHDEQSRWIRSFVLIALAGVLVWQVVTRGFAAHLALAWPEAALSFNSSEPVALVTLADGRLNAAPTDDSSNGDGPSQHARLNTSATFQDTGDRIRAWSELALRAAREERPSDKVAPLSKQNTPPNRRGTEIAKSERYQASAEAELALLNDPLNARALRILGQLADDAGDDARAAQLMQAAAERSWSESFAIYWMMVKAFKAGNYASSLRYADAFLRKRPQFMAQTLPTLVKIAESDKTAAVDGLKTLLTSNPPWRTSFFSKLPGHVTDARTPLQLLMHVKQSDTPPTVGDLRGYINFLIKNKFYELAYYTWLQFLPPEQLARAGFLANGSFEVPPSGLPFDWIISKGSSGVTTDIALRPERDGERALHLEFGPGRAHFRGVSQILMLGPGNYQLKGRYMGEISGRRGLLWEVTCAGAPGKQIGKSSMFLGTAHAWTEFVIPISVSNLKDCRAQKLRLTLAARSESERLVAGEIWFDEMQISRASNSEVPDHAQAIKPPERSVRSPSAPAKTETGSVLRRSGEANR